MVHTLVGKAMLLQLQGHGFPVGAICRTLDRVRDKMEKFGVFFVL